MNIENLKSLRETVKQLSGLANAFDALGAAAKNGTAFIPVDAFVVLCEFQFELVNDVKELCSYLCKEAGI